MHFGNLTLAKEQAREAGGIPPLDTFLQDVRYGLRGIRRAKAFSLLLVLTLALGIGATTAITENIGVVSLRMQSNHAHRRPCDARSPAAGIRWSYVQRQTPGPFATVAVEPYVARLGGMLDFLFASLYDISIQGD